MKHALRPEPKVNQTTIENTMNLGQIQFTQKFIIKHPCTYQTTKIECLCFSPNFPMAYFGHLLVLVSKCLHQTFGSGSLGRKVTDGILGFNGKNQRV